MENDACFLRQISDVSKVITPIDSTERFPEVLDVLLNKYSDHIDLFCKIIRDSKSSADVLRSIRSAARPADERMALLKMYRRCVSPVVDTETSKKIRKVDTETLVDSYGHTFKPIKKLQSQFADLPAEQKTALAALIGEYDTRGQLGYQLTEVFFDWFESQFADRYSIAGPRRAGKDIELSDLFPGFGEAYPCDFVIRRIGDEEIVAVGFARYDSTRGGAQSDDRTGGNALKVHKAQAFDAFTDSRLKLVFLSDGPGLLHHDTWKEACNLDGQWNDRVRVVTLKIAPERLTAEWLES